MIEFREAVLTSLLNLLRTSLENSLKGEDGFTSESEAAKLAGSQPLSSSLVAKFNAKEEVIVGCLGLTLLLNLIPYSKIFI